MNISHAIARIFVENTTNYHHFLGLMHILTYFIERNIVTVCQ